MTLASTSLQGRKALVTGAQQGIGKASVLALARAGADVAVNWLDDQSAAETIAGEVEALGRRTVLIQGRVDQAARAQAIVDQAVDGLGGLDLGVNNAGLFPRSPFRELGGAEWDAVLGVNL